MDKEFDKTKIYISPSKEMMTAFVDEEWKQYFRQDVVEEMEVKKRSLNNSVIESNKSLIKFNNMLASYQDRLPKELLVMWNNLLAKLITNE